MTLYITKNGQQLGPYSLEEAQRFVAAGNLAATDLAWYEGQATWIPLTQVPGFVNPASQTSPMSGPPPFREGSMPRERPVMVWVISLLYFVGTFFGAIGLVLFPFISRLPNLPDAQKEYFESLGPLYYCGQGLGLLLHLVGAILLFMLRRQALYFFGGAFILEILQMILQFLNPSWTAMFNAFSVVGIVIGWSISIAILWYVWHLARTKVLR